jgi:hypothetical protein
MGQKTNKIQAHGHLGQERTSSLLSEQFWVLRRSVDVDGADFLIQMANQNMTFGDPVPPRLCTVQSKFSQDEKTSHKIPINYVLDVNGKPIPGFFVIVHMGFGGNKKRYLLSSSDIIDNLPRTSDGTAYSIAKRAYSEEFEEPMDEDVLNRLEKELLKLTEEDRLRLTIPNYAVRKGSLSEKWLMPLPNEFGFIPDLVFRIRTSAKTALENMAAEYEAIAKIMSRKDVAEIADAVDDLDTWLSSDTQASVEFTDMLKARISGDYECLKMAIVVHERRYKMLSEDEEKYLSFVCFANKSVQICFEELKNMKQERVPVHKNAFQLIPTQCAITFSVDNKNHEAIEVEHASSIGPKSPWRELKENERRVEGLIFTGRHEYLGGELDMDRLYTRVCATYFECIFPNESVPFPKVPEIISD